MADKDNEHTAFEWTPEDDDLRADLAECFGKKTAAPPGASRARANKAGPRPPSRTKLRDTLLAKIAGGGGYPASWRDAWESRRRATRDRTRNREQRKHATDGMPDRKRGF